MSQDRSQYNQVMSSSHVAPDFHWAQRLHQEWKSTDLFSMASILQTMPGRTVAVLEKPAHNDIWYVKPRGCSVNLYCDYDNTTWCPGVLDYRGWRPLNREAAGPLSIKLFIDDRTRPPKIVTTYRPALVICDPYTPDPSGSVEW
jgi:hypothetical protein